MSRDDLRADTGGARPVAARPAFVPKGRYIDPRVPRPRARAALPADLAQRLPGRRGRAGRPVRRLRDRRPVDRGGPHRGGAAGLLQRLPAPGHPAGAGAGPDRRVPMPVPRLALEPRRLAQVPGGRGQLRSPSGRGALPARVPGRYLGRLGLRQHRRPRPSRWRTSSTPSPSGWTASSSRTCASPGTSR